VKKSIGQSVLVLSSKVYLTSTQDLMLLAINKGIVNGFSYFPFFTCHLGHRFVKHLRDYLLVKVFVFWRSSRGKRGPPRGLQVFSTPVGPVKLDKDAILRIGNQNLPNFLW